MTVASADVDNAEWREAIGEDPRLTTKLLMAGYYYTDSAETDLTDDQLDEASADLYELGYFAAVLVLDEQAAFDCRKTLPKANR
jgi:hypothetical protein